MGTNTVASMVVFEGGAPKKADYRRFNIRGGTEGVPDDFAAMEEVLGAALAQWERQQDLSPHDPKRNESLRDAAEPHRHRRRARASSSAGLRALQGFREGASPSSRWPSGSRRSSCPGVREPLRCAHDTPALQLLQRVRDEAHRFAITHHRDAARPAR